MFYPTCYVYKITSDNDSTSNNETNSSDKKSDISSIKKSKTSTLTSTATTTSTTNSTVDLLSNINKTDNTLIKNLSNQLLISAQRNNCTDIENKYAMI